jgi:hypothetical protein
MAFSFVNVMAIFVLSVSIWSTTEANEKGMISAEQAEENMEALRRWRHLATILLAAPMFTFGVGVILVVLDF